MTETKAPYNVETWTVANTADSWPPPIDRTLIALPPAVAQWYVIGDDGRLYANPCGEDETAFRALWDHLCRLETILPRAIGNVLNHAELAFRDPCPTCHGGDAICYECNGFGYTQDNEYAPRLTCMLCGGSGKCPDCLGYGTVEGTLYVEMAEKAGRRIGTLRQYKRVYNPHTGVAPERQRPGVKYSYDREVCSLPPEQQNALLNRIEAGEFENSSQVHAERKRIQREPPKETFNPEPPVACPICGGMHGFKRETMEWPECEDCGAHATEVAQHLAELQTAVISLLTDGDIGAVKAYAAKYGVC